ncbi:MAG: hypothetical protein HC933_19175 [Pleurocapsa sp. SU_196_0]|nr:hypothetical protein [Pleurocapsa sp. SU_196_0]
MKGVYQVFVKRWDGSRWVALGSALNRDSSFNAFDVALRVDARDGVVVAWTERSNTSDGKASGPGRIYVARWDGKTWLTFGASPSKKPNSAPDLPVLALLPDGNPVLAWNELSPDFNGNSVFVDRWNSETWQAVDIGSLSSDVSSASRSMDIAVTKKGEPMLAWSRQLFDASQGVLDFNVFVGGWNGSSWTRTGGSVNVNPARYAGAPSLALDALDRPVVAWTEATAGFDVFVKRFDGKVWQAFGNSVNGATGLANAPRLALDTNGNPVVAWLENAGSIKVFVKRWEGRAWQPVGNFLNVDAKSYAESLSLALDSSGAPVVAWSEEVTRTQRRVYVKRWNGKAWVGLER